MKKFVIEYPINSSPNTLFPRINSSWGLNEWFADNVQQTGKIFSFKWNGQEEQAEIISEREPEYVRFRWVDADKETFFEFRINIDELTNDVILTVTDFAEEDDIDDAINLWNTQIDKLKHTLGS